jgi:hypothetical protein
VSVLPGHGDGTFGAPLGFPAGLWPVSVALADLTGNGQLDIVVVDTYGGGGVSVLMNQGSKVGQPFSFAAPVSYVVPTQPQAALTVGDFNDDGKFDIAVSIPYYNEIAVLAGNGDGSFQFDADYAVGPGPEGIAVGPFFGPGGTDLAVADAQGTSISLLKGHRLLSGTA